MDKKQHFWLALILGIITGIIFSLVVAMFVTWIYHKNFDSLFLDKFLSQLITSVATLIAAAGAIFGVIRSINNQNKLYQDSQSRKLSTARAFLPLALVEMDEICISALSQLTDENKNEEDISILISETTKETIRLVMEHAQGKIKYDLGDFLSHYQMAISKFERYKIECRDPKLDYLNHKNTKDAIIHWVLLRAISSGYLDYARNTSQEFNKEKARKNFKKVLRDCKEIGRYKNVSAEEFNKIFNEALIVECPSLLYTHLSWT